MAAGLLTAGAGHPWETGVVAALDRPGAPLTVVRRCADIADVLASASTGQAVACLLAADLRRLDTESVEQLRAFGVTVVAVHAAADTRAPARLERVGVTAVVADDSDPAAMVAAVQQALDGPRPQVSGGPRGTSDPGRALGRTPGGGPGDRSGRANPGAPDGAAPHPPAQPRPRQGSGQVGAGSSPVGAGGHGAGGRGAGGRREPGPGDGGLAGTPVGTALGAPTGTPIGTPTEPVRGEVIAVWGPGGAPGRSTVALGLADQFAAAGRSVLLADADVYGGILASAFGLLDESAGLAGACRLAANGRLDAAELTGLCWSVGPRFAVLTGIARADRWPEVRPSAIPAVLDVARGLAEVVVVDCSAVLELDEEISFDTMAPRRNGATLEVLDHADQVVAVGSADPPGMERLVRGLAELAEAVEGPAPRVVLNRVRRTAAAPGELLEATRHFTGTEPLAMLPEDRAACDRAWHEGRTLSTVAPRSPLTAALGKLAGELLPAAGGGAGR